MAKKRGITTLAEAVDSRENALRVGEFTKRNFKDLIPHRIDNNTVILINSHKDKTEQIGRFIEKLEKDRRNY